MKNLRNLLLTAAVVAMSTLPLAAETMGLLGDAADPTFGQSIDEGRLDPMKQNEVTAQANVDFYGNIVYSADGRIVGRVSSVSLDTDGSLKLWIDLNSSIVSKADAFMMNVPADAHATGAVSVPLTEADLITSLDNQLQHL